MAGIYIHIPFCKKKCIYCDFYSIGARGLEDAYVDALVKECAMRKDELRGSPLRTLYIGGGTPSLLKPELIARLLKGLQEIAAFNTLEECTIEVNPDDVTPEYIRSLTALGINRVSMGIQSFVDKELSAINRRHNAAAAIEAVRHIRDAGISNISIDLIYGLPGQTLESWRYSLEKAIELDTPHISCYNLSYEEGTRLFRMRECGIVTECSEDDCISMYKAMVDILSGNGYEHYEVSNFAKNGLYSRHNSGYWNGEIYLGLGAAAHSFDGRQRSYNIANARQYIKTITNSMLACERESATDSERYDEYVMIRLRTMWGVDFKILQSTFDAKFCSHFKREAARYIANGMMTADNGIYRLTEDGIMLSDMIIRDLMY